MYVYDEEVYGILLSNIPACALQSSCIIFNVIMYMCLSIIEVDNNHAFISK